MNRNALLAAALVVGASGMAATYPALAESNMEPKDQAEMQAALSAKVAMVSAINAAEKKSGGKAMEAVFSDENGTTGYEVTTVTPDAKEHNLFVDATSGAAVKATPMAENENENDDNSAMDDSEEGE